MTKCAKKQAFTLIELLAVIAVIAILLALLIPGLQIMREWGKAASCLSNIRQLNVAYHSMFADNGKLPQVAPGVHYNWSAYMIPTYLAAELRCPSTRNATEKAYRYTFRYAYNDALNDYYPTLNGLPVPASQVLIVSEAYYFPEGLTSYTAMNLTMLGTIPNPYISGDSGFRAQNHFGGLNLGFLDGHAELVKPNGNTWSPTSTTYAHAPSSDTGLYYYGDQFRRVRLGQTQW
ncbi:MAG: type II secretion system protein [Chthoniobacterales bacterium]